MEQKYAPSSSVTEKMTPRWEKDSTFSLRCFRVVLSLVRLFKKLEEMAGRDGACESRPTSHRVTDISHLLLSCTSNIPNSRGRHSGRTTLYHSSLGANQLNAVGRKKALLVFFCDEANHTLRILLSSNHIS